MAFGEARTQSLGLHGTWLLAALALAWGCTSHVGEQPHGSGGVGGASASGGVGNAAGAGAVGGGGTGDGCVVGGGCPLCADEVNVGSLEDVLAQLPSSWPEGSRLTAGAAEQITADLVATEALTLDPAAVNVPANCASLGCEPNVQFVLGGDPLTGPPDGDPVLGVAIDTSGLVTIGAGTSFRIAPFVLECEPYCAPTAQLRLYHSCSGACPYDRRVCDGNVVCYQSDAYCRFCALGAASRCACSNLCGDPMQDGTACTYWVEPDMSASGSCQQGTCLVPP